MKSKYFLCGMLATTGVSLFHILIYPYLFAANFGNVSYYILLSLIFAGVFFGSSFFADYFKFDFEYYKNSIYVLFLVCFSVWFVSMYFYENESYYFFDEYSLRHRIPFYLYFLSLFAFSCGIFFLLVKFKKKIRVLRIVSAIVLSLVQTIVLAAPNIINDHGGNLFHIHAFFNPVYNIVKGLPFDGIIESIYGHYPLFYYFPMKILTSFGIPMIYSAMSITVLFGFVSFLLIYLSMDRVIKFDGLYYISILAVSYISFYYYQSGQYYQILPHRILFPAITVFIISIFYLKKMPAWILILVASLGLLWNFESGIICLIILVFHSAFTNIILDGKNKIKEFTYELLMLFAPIALSYFCLNIVNLILGGKYLTFKDFIYPIMSNDFKIGELAIKIPTFFSLFLLEFAVFMILLCYFFIKCFKRTLCREELFVLSVSLMGLGMFPYYFNRAAFANVSIVHIPFVIALSMMIQLNFENYIISKKTLKNGIVLFAGSVIFAFFCLGSLSGIPLTINERVNSSWKIGEYNEMCNIIKEYIPSDTAAVGPGLTDIYSSLDWDPQIYVMDWSDWDCSQTKREYALNEINSKDSILLCNSSAVGYYLNKEEWVTIECLFDAFYYMVRVEGENGKKDYIVHYSEDNEYSIEEFIDLCFLNCYNTYSDDERMDYYLAVYDIVQDRGVLYDFILDDYNINKFGF